MDTLLVALGSLAIRVTNLMHLAIKSFGVLIADEVLVAVLPFLLAGLNPLPHSARKAGNKGLRLSMY